MYKYQPLRIKAAAPATLLVVGVWLLLGAWSLAPGPAGAAQKLTLSCSAQVYEVLRDETLALFTEKTGIEVETEVYTSMAAVSRLNLGLADVAAVAGPLSLRFRSLGFLEHPFCRDAMIVVGNAQVGIDNISLEKLRAVFAGKITNWEELGGPNKPIRVIVPNLESAAYQNFSRMVMGGQDIAFYALAYQSTAAGELARCVPYAVSFVNLAATQGRPKGIRIISIEGLSPKDKDYPFTESFSVITKGRPSEAADKLLDFLAGDEAAQVLLKRGVTPCSVCDEGVLLRPGKAAGATKD